MDNTGGANSSSNDYTPEDWAAILAAAAVEENNENAADFGTAIAALRSASQAREMAMQNRIPIEMTFFCEICPISKETLFEGIAKLEAHIADVHFDCRPYRCPFCADTRFATYEAICAHLTARKHAGRNANQVAVDLSGAVIKKREQVRKALDSAIRFSLGKIDVPQSGECNHGLAAGNHPCNHFTLKKLTGQVLLFTNQFWLGRTVRDFKEGIQKFDGIPPEQQALIHNGREMLDEDRTLAEYGVGGGSRIDLCLSCRQNNHVDDENENNGVIN